MAKTYRRIPGIGTGRAGLQVALRSRMYQGPDHLLIVHSTGYTEEYRRIFYRDIRYVDIRPSRRQMWHGVISGILIALIGLLWLTVSWRVAVVFIIGPALWFVINLARGPSCDCYVTTGVQTLRLPAPARRRKIARLISFLRGQAAATATTTAGAIPAA